MTTWGDIPTWGTPLTWDGSSGAVGEIVITDAVGAAIRITPATAPAISIDALTGAAIRITPATAPAISINDTTWRRP